MQHVKNTKWLEKYEGKNLIKGYCKRFCVDELCALTEMEMLGYKVSGKERQKAIKAMEARKMQKLKKKEKRERKQKQYEEIYSDEPFYFIAGYTENGVPFGITHKEMETDLSETAQKNNEKWNVFDEDSVL
ncbi:hypothetical protein D4N35_011580 [Siminovitchia fortis]|uniref:Uncharacterized protein n=1 Tax=Siminovitchia fortis TaxID=254758 RepID=A0A443IPL0_9BACI|nr:hypothetical protein D4N35_011580 [Siminovitchia fortis]